MLDDTAPPEGIRTIRDAIERKASLKGDDTFLRYHDRRLSYEELDRKANAVANELLDRGLEPGDHVCMLLYNSPDHLILFFALAKIGAVAVPVDTRFTGETLEYVLSHSDAATIVLDPHTRESYEEVRNDVPNVTTEYLVSENVAESSYRDFRELIGGSNSSPPAGTVEGTDTATLTYVQRRPADRPRGVLSSHFSYVNTGWEAGYNLFDYTPEDRVLTTLPLYSIFTTQIGIMGALLSEAQFVLEDRFDPETFWDAIERHKATIFLYLSRMLSVLYNQDIEPVDGTTANMAVGASPGFAPDTKLFKKFEDRFDLTIFEGYGSTQTSTLAAYNRPGDRKLDSVGKPPSYAEVAIVDEHDWPVPTGERGELVVRPTRPNTMMQGYYDEPELTVEDCRNQWIHTGGIGYKDEDGYIYFVATEENSIYRGRIAGRISSLEIESVINANESVRNSAVVGVVNEDGSEEIKAVVVPEGDAAVNPVEICKHCKQRLPYLKVPRYIEIRNELPRTASGEIRKQDLDGNDLNGVWDRESGYELSR